MKGKVAGRRRPFRWAAPRYSMSGVDLFPVFESISKRFARQDDTLGVVPDLLPYRVGVFQVTSFRQGSLSRARLHRFTAEALRAHGMPEEVLMAIYPYSARRTLPTMAHLMGYANHERHEIGGWYFRATAQESAMPLRYSDARLFMQASLKHSLLQAFAKGLALKKQADGLANMAEWSEVAPFVDRSCRISLSGDVIDSSKTFKATKQVHQSDSASDESSSSTSTNDEDDDRAQAADDLD